METGAPHRPVRTVQDRSACRSAYLLGLAAGPAGMAATPSGLT